MELAQVFAFLIQLHVCAPVAFNAPSGAKLTVLVCPIVEPAAPAKEPEAKPESPKTSA